MQIPVKGSRRLIESRIRLPRISGSIAGIDYLEIARDILHDARSWDLILIMRFASIAVLRSHQQHPEHQKLMAFNQPFVADVASVDFEFGGL